MPNYDPILDSEIDAESPITESLITRLRDNPLALFSEDYIEITGSGNYTVPANVNLLKVIMIGGGAGGGAGGGGLTGGSTGDSGGGGGGCGCVIEKFVSTSSGASISYACGSGGAGATTNGASGSDGGNTNFGLLTAPGGKGGTGGSTSVNDDFGLGVKNNEYLNVPGADGSPLSSTSDKEIDMSYIVFRGNRGTGNVGGGGAPGVLGRAINTASLGNGGDGGTSSVIGQNATTYGAGGGGGGSSTGSNGGNGSAGIIFVLPLNI